MANDTISFSPARTKSEARAMGLKKYFTGKPCKNGHIAERYVTDPNCLECTRIRHERTKRQRREYRRRHDERHRDEPAWRARRSEQSRLYQTKALEEIAGRKKPKNCEVCGSQTRISFDHCHKTGQFRGWLCSPCNFILGLSHEGPQTLRKLARYLERFKGASQKEAAVPSLFANAE